MQHDGSKALVRDVWSLLFYKLEGSDVHPSPREYYLSCKNRKRCWVMIISRAPRVADNLVQERYWLVAPLCDGTHSQRQSGCNTHATIFCTACHDTIAPDMRVAHDILKFSVCVGDYPQWNGGRVNQTVIR